MSAPSLQSQPFQYVREADDEFLALFPHRGDYLWAVHPDPGERPNFQTESRHLLADRLILQGAYLYGVRFSKTTRYMLIDIDLGSPYHPAYNRQAFQDILAALEPLGLVQHVPLQSSDRTTPKGDRRGIHLYFPFEEEQNSYQLAFAVKACLERAGFKIRDGCLEIYPNPRPYQAGQPALHRGHRLPLQRGSYLLNADYEPTFTTPAAFVAQWKLAQRRNDVNRTTIEQLSQQLIRKTQLPSTSAAKFNADLDAEINVGFTESGQTNYLLGRITMKGYIFHHVLEGGDPLEGDALADYTIKVIKSLPGYTEFCGHQHEIEQKARDYARSIVASKYYHYVPGKKKRSQSLVAPGITESDIILPQINEQRSAAAKQRITNAISDLLQQDKLPAQATARKWAISSYGISPQTLYKHRELWHPDHLHPVDDSDPIDHTPPADRPSSEMPEPPPSGRVHTTDSNKLVPPVAAPSEQATQHSPEGGCGGGSLNVAAHNLDFLDEAATEIHRQLAHVRHQQAAAQAARDQARQVQQHQKFQAWLASGDPILESEARSWFDAIEIDSTPAIELPASALSSRTQSETYQDEIAPEPLDISDLSNVIAQIDCERMRLRWQPEDLQQYCLDQYRQPSYNLSDADLINLLLALRQIE